MCLPSVLPQVGVQPRANICVCGMEIKVQVKDGKNLITREITIRLNYPRHNTLRLFQGVLHKPSTRLRARSASRPRRATRASRPRSSPAPARSARRGPRGARPRTDTSARCQGPFFFRQALPSWRPLHQIRAVLPLNIARPRRRSAFLAIFMA